MTSWTEADIPDQTDRFAIVTGATSGLGYETARALAGKGAHVVLAVRDEQKGRTCAAKVKQVFPTAKIEVEPLDLASLRSIAAFGQRLLARDRPVDLLINNAGVMAVPTRQLTEDGFELQLGTNHLGHFALTGRLLPLLLRGQASRVVSVSSIVHRYAHIDWIDLQREKDYRPMQVYGQSKLAVLLFARELHLRSQSSGWGILSNAAHPGFARTGLQTTGPNLGRKEAGKRERNGYSLIRFLSQDAAQGALPTLFAATSPAAQGGAYYGPSGLFELKGSPIAAKMARQALDNEVTARLWMLSEQLTSVTFG